MQSISFFLVFITTSFLSLISGPRVHAQLHPPVWSSYLSQLSLNQTPKVKYSQSIEMRFRKDGGPQEHTEHQMYLIAYLEKDEKEILKLAAKEGLLDKSKPKLFFDVLIEKKLITVLDSQVAQKSVDISPKKINSFHYEFSFSNAAVVTAIQELGNYEIQEEKSTGESKVNKFKLLGFVPVNDCKLATKVAPELNRTEDFARLHDAKSSLHLKTPILYFKPLPYRFELQIVDKGKVRLFID